MLRCCHVSSTKSGVKWPDCGTLVPANRCSSGSRAIDHYAETQWVSYAGLQSDVSDEQAWARRWGGGKLERDAALRKTVLGYLQWGWSPEQVAGHMAREAAERSSLRDHLSFQYGQVARTKDYSGGTTCREARRDGDPMRSGRSPAGAVRRNVRNRQTPGHWEAECSLASHLARAPLALAHRCKQGGRPHRQHH